MNSLKVPESGLVLDGSSDGDSAVPPQTFFLSLSDDVVEGLIQGARDGEHLYLALGDDPTLHYGPRSHQIAPPRDDAPYELFLTKPFESTRRAERIPRTTSLFARPKTAIPDQKKPARTKAASSLDPDIEALQNGLTAHEAARERTHFVERLPTPGKVSEKVKNKLWAGYNATPKSMPTPTALNATNSPSSTPALSASQQVMERKREQRVVLVHELAVKDRTTEYLRGKWTGKEDEFRPTLEKTADYSAETKRWSMKSCWKELDVWKYDYSSKEERQTAIDNATLQYDKQRLSSEVGWQRLLPMEERGRGKCLSCLQTNLIKGPAQPAPKIKVQRADDSSGSRDDGDSLDGDKPRASEQAMSRSSSNPLPAKTKKPTAQEAQAKRLLGKKPRTPAQKPPPAKVKPGPKPTGGRVLSAAIIENSDSSGDEAAAAPNPKPAAPSNPKDMVVVKTRLPGRDPLVKPPQPPQPPQHQPTKRCLEDDNSSSSSGTPLSKRIKPKQPLPAPSSKRRPLKGPAPSRSTGTSSARTKNTSPTKSSPPTNASDLDEASPSPRPAPQPKRKPEGEGKVAPAKRRAVESVPSEVLTKALKFKAYYQKYEALHYEISALDNPPHQKLADLLDMRDRLQMMKKEIYEQYSPERRYG